VANSSLLFLGFFDSLLDPYSFLESPVSCDRRSIDTRTTPNLKRRAWHTGSACIPAYSSFRWIDPEVILLPNLTEALIMSLTERAAI